MFHSSDSPFRFPLVFIVVFPLLAMLLLNFVLVSTASQSVRAKRTQAHLIKESSKIKKFPMVQPVFSGEKETILVPGNRGI